MRRPLVAVPEAVPMPTIDPISDDAAGLADRGAIRRPFWSVMIPSHNRADLLERTLASVLANTDAADPADMQIEVVDDGSAADAAPLVESLGHGRVEFHRHDRSMGASATFTDCARRARGHWVHILHSDDLVGDGFYSAYRAQIETLDARGLTPVMAVCRSFRIDALDRIIGISALLGATDGVLDNGHSAIAQMPPFDFASVVVARSAYEQAGGFHPALPHANDWDMWERIASLGPVAVVDGVHAQYRLHDGSDTTALHASSTYLTDPLAAAELIARRVDNPALAVEVRRLARSRAADSAIESCWSHAQARQRRRALADARWALRLRPSLRTAATVLETLAPLVRSGS